MEIYINQLWSNKEEIEENTRIDPSHIPWRPFFNDMIFYLFMFDIFDNHIFNN